MRWLPRWEELGDRDKEDWAGYTAHLDALRPAMPPTLVELSETSLHDGKIDRLRINEINRTVTLRLVIGDLQRGYSLARLKYRNATLNVRGAALRWLVEYPETELIADEIDRTDHCFVHRLCFWPAGEVHIAFASVDVRVTALPNREFRSQLRFSE